MTKASEANLDKVRHSKWALIIEIIIESLNKKEMLGVTRNFVNLNFGHQISQI